MNKQILVVYKSVTGFTKQYAEWIAEKLNCSAVELKKVSAETMSEYKTIIFGGRFHAGFVDGLKNAKALFEKSTAEKLIVFATGATPNSATEMIEEAWKNNLTTEEMDKVPHFYMQGGLRYENMPFGDKLMMKVFAAMVKRKKEKSEYEKEMLKALNTSYDHTSKEYIEPLADFVLGRNADERSSWIFLCRVTGDLKMLNDGRHSVKMPGMMYQ